MEKTFLHWSRKWTTAILFLLLLCNNLIAQPTITSFSPSSGGIGTEVTITGTNFSTTPANNIVWFGAVRAEVTAATSTTLKTIVPVGVSHEPISVTVDGLTAFTNIPFNQTFKSNGTISFGSEFSISGYYDDTWHYFRNSAAGDLDNDGKIDIVVVGPYSPYNLYIMRNTSTSGSVTFADIQTISSIGSVAQQAIRIADMNGDGKKDVIVLSSDVSSAVISVFPNTSSLGNISFGTRVDVTAADGYYPKNMDVADFNLDGKPDIAVALNNSSVSYNHYCILQNTSSGSISFSANYYKIRTDESLGNESNDLAAGDLDDDGRPDLIITGSDYIDYYNSTAGVYVLRNTSTSGSMAFDTPGFLETSGRYGVDLIDCDMDGKPDLISRNDNRFYVLKNTSSSGAVSFASEVGYFEGNTYYDIKGVDFDGDHRTDIMTACASLSWPFQNTSSGIGNVSFNRLYQEYSGYTVNPCDLNADGKPDFFLGRGYEGIYGKISTTGVSAFSASSSSVDFGNRLVGSSNTQTVTISNSGSVSLTISSVTSNQADFTVSPASTTISAGDDTVITITYTPTSSGSQSGRIIFYHDAPFCQNTIQVSGTGVFEVQANAGNMLTLNGSSQYLESDIVTTATDNVTLEAWVNWDGQSSGSQGIVYQGNSASNGYGIMLYSGATPARALTILCGGKAFLTSSTELPTSSWHHVAAVRDNGTWHLYLDGVEQTITNTSTTPNTPTDKCNIGSSSAGGNKFKGKIDEVRIWTVARSQSQIRSSYASLAGDETGLAAYWRIDESSGTTTGDGSGHTKTATLYNSPTWGTSTAPVTTPVFSASPSSHAFENVLIGESGQQTITVSNTGGGVLHISAISTPDATFAITPTSANISAGGNQVFTLTFTPTATTALSGNLSFTDNIGNHTAGVNGTGLFQAQAGAETMLTFDGTDDYGKTDLITMSTNYTISFWLKTTQSAANWIAGFYDPTNTAYTKGPNVGMYYDGRVRFLHRIPASNSGGTNVYSITAVNDGEWHQVTAVFNGTYQILYIDGVQEGGSVSASGAIGGDVYLYLGINGSSSSPYYYAGNLDELRLYDTALSKDQVQAAYSSLAGNESNLIGYWRMDEGSGTTTSDGSGHSKTATLYNSPTWENSTAPVAAPVYQTSDGSLSFGGVTVNATSDKTYTITNNGGGFLNIASVSSNNGLFTVSPTSATIAASGNQEFTATFAPTTHGAQTGTLTLTHNPNGAMHTISVSGTGQQALFSASSSTLEFGNTQINVGKSLPVTITNNGNIALSITGIVCNPANYTISPTTASVSAGGSQVFTVTLTPTATGSVPGTITFTDNALNSPQQISATGTGVELFGSGTEADPYQIATLYDLKFLSEHSSYWANDLVFIQTSNIDASATSTWNSNAGFSPIGNSSTKFQGTYNGDGYLIDGLVINRSGTDYQGLFGATTGGVIRNLGVTDVSVSGREHIGGLIGYNGSSSMIENCYSTGTVTGYSSSVGGLAGTNYGSSLITKCYSTVTCTMTGSNLYSLGGLVGYNYSSTISNSYASGSVTGIYYVGGLAGNNTAGTITKCYSAGAVSGTGNFVSGLVGYSDYNVNYSFWDTETSGQPTSHGGTGKTTAEMRVRATFTAAGWDFRGETANGEDDIWNIGNSRNNGYPYLDWQYPSDGVIDLATVSTTSISSITTSSASSGGSITNNANGTAVTARGICWNTSQNPTTANSSTSNGSGVGTFTSSITGLTANTTYYVRAFATNLAGTAYGENVSFTTLQAPTVTTQAVASILTTTATGNGTITVLGNPSPSQHGVCWSTTENPTIESSKTEQGAASSTGAYTASMTGLTPNTTYHVRAYATNSVATVYGTDVSFTTLLLPTVTTQAVSNIATTTATGNGNITVLGVPNPAQHGVCWKTSSGPTISDNKTTDGAVSETGAFTSSITGLTPGQTYYVKAYASNSGGTAYGDEVSFTAYLIPTVSTQAVSAIGITTATGNGNITVLGVPNPTQHGVCWSTSENPTTADSKTEGGSASATGAFTSSITGLASLTTYFVRAYATNSVGTTYGDQVSFTTLASEPTTQASNIVCSDPGNGTFTLNWTNGNGTKRAVFLKETTSSSAEPADNTTYTANASFGSGTQIGSTGWYCVYNGTDTTVTVTGLIQSGTYRAMVCEYNGAPGGENYMITTATNNPVNYVLPWFIQPAGISLNEKRYASAAWGDIDNDGDLDLITTGIENSYSLTHLYRNNGDNTFTLLSGHGIPNMYNVFIEWNDFDNDGYVDLLLGDYYTIKVYRNNHNNTFTLTVNINTGAGISIYPTWKDYNNDGYLDVLATSTGSTGFTKLYTNDRNGSLAAQNEISFGQFRYGKAAWGDYNNDGYPDIFITGFIESDLTAILYKNLNGVSFEAQSGMPWVPVYYPSAAWADYNNDGYPDLAVAGYNNSYGETAKIYKNNGDNTFSMLNTSLQCYSQWPTLAWGDYNSDGDPDLVISGSSSGMITRLYKNNGSDTFENQTNVALLGVYQGSSVWGDYDNDSDPDLLIAGDAGYYEGSYHGRTILYQNIGNSPNTVPGAPSNLQTAVSDNITFSWDKATDTETSQNGLGYNLYVGTSEGTGNILSPAANIATGKRRIAGTGNVGQGTSYTLTNLPGGTYYWGVQAIDAGNIGGAFASGGSFSAIGSARNIIFSQNQADKVTVSWTNGANGEKRKVFVKESLTGMPEPVNGTDYTPNQQFGLGGQIGSSGWYCVYDGTGNNTVITGISHSQNYRIAVVEYAGTGDNLYYLARTAPGNPRNRFAVVVGSGNALSFDGSDDYISASPDVPSGSEPFTVEAWVNIDQSESRYVAAWGKDNYNANTFAFRISNTSIGCKYGSSNWFPEISSIAGKWTHIAYSFDGTNLNFYVNAVLIYSASQTPSTCEDNDLFCIGALHDGSDMTNFFDGQMDELRVWDVGLTQSELVANMCKKLNPTNESHLVAYYDFDQAPNSTILYDRKFDGDGTLTNMDAANAWIKSGALIGDQATVLQSTAQTVMGNTGQCCNVTITSTPNASNYLSLYTAANGFGNPISVADVGLWPTGITKRADIIWGVHAVGSVTANLVFDYSQVEGITDPGLIRLIKRADANSEWIDVTADFTHNINDRTFTKLNNSTFSEYSVGTEEGDNSLPVELSSFTAGYDNDKVILNWTTESETENLGFIIERRLDPKNPSWERIASFQKDAGLKGQGTKSGQTKYKFADNGVKVDQTYYYRLLDVDYSGACRVNDTLSINPEKYLDAQIPDKFALLPAYPNPFNPKTTITFHLPKDEYMTLTVYNIKGQRVATLVDGPKTAGVYHIDWEPQMLSSGVYLIRIQAGRFISVKKCILMK